MNQFTMTGSGIVEGDVVWIGKQLFRVTSIDRGVGIDTLTVKRASRIWHWLRTWVGW